MATVPVLSPGRAQAVSTPVDEILEYVEQRGGEGLPDRTRMLWTSLLIKPVALLLRHPRILHAAATLVTSIESRAVSETVASKLIFELAANPAVNRRWDVVRELLPLAPDAALALEPSHAAALAARPDALAQIVRMRYADAPFVSADTLLAALPRLGDPLAAVRTYLAVLPFHAYRLQLHWERAFAMDAAEHARALEAHLRAHHPAVLADALVRCGLLNATRDAAHTAWLLAHDVPLSPRAAHSALAAARNAAALAAVPRAPPIERVLHAARLGLQPPTTVHGARWAVCARTGAPVPPGPHARDERKFLRRFQMLSANGMDWDGALYVLGRYSPVYQLYHHSLLTERKPGPLQSEAPSEQPGIHAD